MPYTLAKIGLWLIGAGVVGLVAGWMLRGLRRPAPVEESAPMTADDETELARLRVRVNYLEPLAAEAERLRGQLEEHRSGLVTYSAAGDSRPPDPSRATSSSDSGAPGSGDRGPDDTWPADLPLQGDALRAEHERLAALLASYQAENGELRARLWNSDAQIHDLQSVVSEYRAAMVPPDPDLEAGAAVLGTTVLMNDLTVVEGIGPKIATVLRESGITTWWQLHLAHVDTLRAVLEAAGPRFQVHDPITWPAQAGLLAHGNWHEFVTLLDVVKGGKLAG